MIETPDSLGSRAISSGQESLDRRRFLSFATATALMALHDTVLGRPAAAAAPAENTPRLLRLQLETAASLTIMKEFYCGALGLPMVSCDSEELSVSTGESVLAFRHCRETDRRPFYHFAFNIPENKILSAREWQRKRSPVIPPYEHLRDPRYPDDVVWFRHWNAHSVFFFDPAGNLVEFIARHDLRNRRPGGFSTDDILYASEIAFITSEVRSMAEAIRATSRLPEYQEGSDAFTAIGDETGLLLVMKTGRMLGFDQGRPAGVFPTRIELASGGPTSWQADDHPYLIATG